MCTHLIHRLVMCIASLHKFALLSHLFTHPHKFAAWDRRPWARVRRPGERRDGDGAAGERGRRGGGGAAVGRRAGGGGQNGGAGAGVERARSGRNIKEEERA
jgi:uncharacterized membrane protein YgcG